jgi:hypothetical protein
MIWREGEHIYVCPENYQSGAWNLYEYNTNSDSLEFIKPVLSEKLTDATIFKDGSDYYILSTYEPRPNGNTLTIWKSSSPDGTFVKTQEIKFPENIARNAGSIFNYNGKLIRPAQECNKSYGHAVSFQAVTLENGLAVIDVHKLSFPVLGGIYVGLKELLVKLHLKKPFEIK